MRNFLISFSRIMTRKPSPTPVPPRERPRVTKVERDRATGVLSLSRFRRLSSKDPVHSIGVYISFCIPRSRIHSAGCCCMNENRRPRKPARIGARQGKRESWRERVEKGGKGREWRKGHGGLLFPFIFSPPAFLHLDQEFRISSALGRVPRARQTTRTG